MNDELKLKFCVKMRNYFDNIKLAKTIISEGVSHGEYYASSGVFGQYFPQIICKTVGNCLSVYAVLQRSNNDVGIKQMVW